jgi:hypothetical protein
VQLRLFVRCGTTYTRANSRPGRNLDQDRVFTPIDELSLYFSSQNFPKTRTPS